MDSALSQRLLRIITPGATAMWPLFIFKYMPITKKIKVRVVAPPNRPKKSVKSCTNFVLLEKLGNVF